METSTVMETTKLKYLSSIAEDVVRRCSQKLGTPLEKVVGEFEAGWKAEPGNYCQKLVEFCSERALISDMCNDIQEKISDGSFSRFTYDLMLAWERPSYYDEDEHTESVAKEKEERKMPLNVIHEERDEIPLFYSDIMPLLVSNEPNVGEDAFVWLASLLPLIADVANGRFTFETLTAPTGHRLHFPAYDFFLKEMDKCIRHLQKQATPNGIEMADDEFILHVEGTANSQRVVRHIGATSWAGRLTLSNYALYFEASGVIKYEDALKIDLSGDTEHTLKPAATGPWGAPLFDKAIIYDSPELSEGIVLEFPEVTSSTRRDHWLALTKEIMLLHQFLSKYKIECPVRSWEMHARTILGIIRLHAAREMLRVSPPAPTKFLIFSLYDEIPKGDYVLDELAESLKKGNSAHPCSASSILRSMDISRPIISGAELEVKEAIQACKSVNGPEESAFSLETAIKQAMEEEKETLIAKATTEELKEEGITDSVMVLMELLKPLQRVVPWFQDIFTWQKPMVTLTVLAASLIFTYMEWIGKALAIFLIWVITKMMEARHKRLNEKCDELVISTASEQSTMESIVSAQQGLNTAREVMQIANVTILKIWSIFISKAHKHSNTVMVALAGLAILLAIVPLKLVIMGIILQSFIASKGGKPSGTGNRRLKEWWDSIPVIPVRLVDAKNPDTANY
ncbi:uncharacterized protein LOC129293267 [Prosopis cineraria]|uniref:uncharacterized protein LOC129293267 n=1 Tax=Prosopis cineraria TaxID=364024 RepID=UPI002410AAE5|nr:uncharacterized protein LOC129293267 [Prosopis cineraria]